MRETMFAAAAALLAGTLGFAQTSTAPGGSPAPVQGFSVPALVFELSLFLPERGAPGAKDSAAQQGGVRPGAPRFTRDPALFLTAPQVDQLTPIFQALRKNPFPTPSGARALESTVDGILSPRQKAEREAFRADRAQRAGKAGGQGASQGPGFLQRLQGMSEQERQAFLQNLPPDVRERVQQRLKQGATVREVSPLEQRQRMIDFLLAALQDRKRELAG